MKLINFLLCFLKKDCPYSIKNLLAIFTIGTVFYLAIWTEKSYYDLLLFCAVLLGIKSFDKITYQKYKDIYIEEEPEVKQVTGFKSNENKG